MNLKTFHCSAAPVGAVACVALTPASSTGLNPRRTGSHQTSSLVGHFPSVDLTSNTAARVSPKAQTETLSCRHNNSHTGTRHPQHSERLPSVCLSNSSPKTSTLRLFFRVLFWSNAELGFIKSVSLIRAGLSVLRGRKCDKSGKTERLHS